MDLWIRSQDREKLINAKCIYADGREIRGLFCSGTTGLAVKTMNKNQNANRDFIGIELDKEYFDIAKERIGE